MTEQEKRQTAIFGTSLDGVKMIVEEGAEAGYSKSQLAISMLSDIQEMLAMGMTDDSSKETIRTNINKIKWIINQ